jgi:hypothetical protein
MNLTVHPMSGMVQIEPDNQLAAYVLTCVARAIVEEHLLGVFEELGEAASEADKPPQVPDSPDDDDHWPTPAERRDQALRDLARGGRVYVPGFTLTAADAYTLAAEIQVAASEAELTQRYNDRRAATDTRLQQVT